MKQEVTGEGKKKGDGINSPTLKRREDMGRGEVRRAGVMRRERTDQA